MAFDNDVFFDNFGQPIVIEDDESEVPLDEDGNPISGEDIIAQFQNKIITDDTAKAEDWRVRLHLAPGADYMYAGSNPGILAPLADTDGIIFPYTPTISVQYNADYQNYDLVHSNYRGYFYKGSRVENLLITATFTAQDRKEANYMLAVMHFMRSATKMFYGNDTQRGMPPPLLFLTGLGEFQFKNHPCVLTMVNYNLPNDVDYIPAGGITTELKNPPRTRLELSGMGVIAAPEDVYDTDTYVPTKLEINFTMLPVNTREQVSKFFSLEDYASGELLKKGYW